MINLKNFFKKNKYPLIILVVSFLIYFRWLSFNIFSANDWIFFWSDIVSDLKLPSVWIFHYNFGQTSFTLWRYPFDFIAGSIASQGYDSNVSEKILYFWPLIIFSSLGSYFLAKQILKSEVAAFISAIVFCSNSYFFSITGQGHLLISLAGALSTFAFLFFIRYFETQKFSTLLTAFLIAFFVGLYDLRVMYLVIGAFFIYWLYDQIFIKSFSNTFRRKYMPFAVSLLLFGMLNLFWLLPALIGGSLSDNQILNRGLFGDDFWSLIHAITLHHPFWNGGKIAWFTVQPVPIHFYLIPILAMCGAIISRKDKKIMFFFILAIIGILLAKQADAPFPQLYLWLYERVPGFNAFREASKFYLYIIVGYSILIGALIKWFWGNKNITKIWKFIPHLFSIIVVVIFLYNAKPIISGEIDTLYVAKQIPTDYEKLIKIQDSQKEYFNTLWLPGCSRWSNYSNQHPVICANEVAGTTWKTISGFSQVGTTYPKQVQISNIIKSNNFDQLLKQGSIRYIIVPKKDLEYGDDLFQYYGNSEFYIDILNQKEFLKKLDFNTPTLQVYEFISYDSFVNIKADNNEMIQSSTSLDYRIVNSNQINISIKNLNQEVFLIIGQNYDPNWLIKIGDYSLSDNIKSNNYSESQIEHQETEVGLNQYRINPSKLCQGNKCLANENGSYDIDLVVHYKTQRHLILGLIISGIVLAAVIIFILISFIRNIGKKRNE